jgi:hypothetical protein
MGLENLKILQEKRARESAEGGDLQSVPLVRMPKQVQAETAAYVKKNNSIQDFVGECLTRDRRSHIAKKEMASQFMKWRNRYKLDVHLLKWDWADLEAALADVGLVWKNLNGIRGFHGFSLKNDMDFFQDEARKKKRRYSTSPTRE